jgi:tRNA threonylcarbamoyladenosine biosynthesis protein TsaE
MRIFLKDTEATEAFGAKLWGILPAKCTVFLQGDLGAGKTTLVRGFMRASGYSGAVKSPTFTLIEEYQLTGRKIFHFDLYRLNDPQELEWIGIRDYFEQQAICFIEWPERGRGFLPEPDYSIELTVKGMSRQLKINL